MRVPRHGAARGPGGLARKLARRASSAPEHLRRSGVKCSNEGRASSGSRRRQREPPVGQLPSGEHRAARASVHPPALRAALLRG
eukprot:8138431-Alexandrium_andersonii.AAC.1